MNRPKKIISFLLAVIMAVSYVPAGAFALSLEEVCEEEHCEEHFHGEHIDETDGYVPDSEEAEEYTHAIPESEGVENAIARAHSLTDVEWTPLADVSGVRKIDGVYTNVFFEAGKTYKGIPYSGVIPTDTYVGLNVSLESFVTALENKNSVLYTENLHSPAYPKASAYFGTVCSKFAQYALNVPGSFNTNNVANIPGMETIALPGEYTVDEIKLGDVVLDTAKHTTIVTDILYNENGDVAFVEISEAVMPLCRRLLWSPEEFYEHFASYRLCRYRYIDEVPAISEFDAEEKHALMPRFGNKYNYKVSSSEGIVDILEKGYSKAVILRDGAIIKEIAIDDSTETFSFDRSVPGKIEMYLEKADGTKSGSVFAMVVDSSVTVTDSASFLGGKLTVSYSGTSGKPLYVQLGTAQNTFCKVEEEELSGEAVVEIKNPSAVSSYRARIAFENEFGIYLSAYSSFDVDLSGGTGPNPSDDPILSKAVYWDGYNITPSSHVPVIQENKVGYWSYTEIPVEGSTEYYSEGATRLWYLDGEKEPISTYNAYKESEIPCTFTTPENCEYVSIAYSSNIIEQGTETIQNLSSSTFSTLSEAALALREKMIARESPITIRVAEGITPAAVLAEAWAHTGVPNEGDYIRHNQIGSSYTTVSGEDENGAYTDITYTFKWLTTAEQEAEVDAAVDALLAELDLWEKTDYEKIKGAYDWITENVEYDFNNEDNDEYQLCHSTYAAIILKEAVCQGYATLYYRMMLELGVDCRYIRGEAGYVERESHAWNIVALEGKYYNMDATWDRDLMGHYRMFLCTEANFTEHIPDSEYTTAEWKAKYPMAIVPYVFNVTASGKLSNGMEWVLDGDTGTLTVAGKGAIPSYRSSKAPWYEYKDSVKAIVVSEGITEVGERAFYWCVNCTSLTLPESLTAIREYGFNNLRALEYVTLPSKLKTIEFCAFSECVALKEIVIPDSVTTCGSSAFSNCYGLLKAVIGKGLTRIPDSMFFADRNLRDVTLPEGLTEIGDTAFADCGIFYFTIPASLTTLGSSVFAGCRNLYDFIVEEGNQYYKAVNGVLFTKDGKTLVAYPGGDISSSYTVPSGTVTIARSAFNDAYRLQYIYFPDSLREIKPYAFAYCSNLWSVTFNSGITKIGDSAFRSCKWLYSVIFENQSVVLESAVFADCDNLQVIYLPTNLKEIPSYLFDDCAKLSEIEIPATVTKIGSCAFSDCDSLKTITIPGNVKTIEQQAFDYCDKLETVIMEEGVQSIGWIAFCRSPKLKKVVIPKSVTLFTNHGYEDWTFSECPNVVLYVTCGTAGWYYARSKNLAHSDTHNYSGKVVPPTCTAQGYTLYTCACGASYKSNYTAALGHSYSATVTAPTCTEEGFTTYTCTRCSYSYIGNYVSATGHSLITEGYVAPTCTEPGYSGDQYCENCDYRVTGEEISAAGHSYSGAFCSVCGAENPGTANYEGKVISIMGDSISTFSGYLPVEDGFNRNHPSFYPKHDVTEVGATWWMQIINDLGAKLGINESWSGSYVFNSLDSNSGNKGPDAAMASVTRIKNLGSNGTPDIIFFFGGTNDIAFGSPLGSFNPETAPTEADLSAIKWESYADAYVAAIMRMQYYYPDAHIIAILPTINKSYYTEETLEEYNSVMRAICSHYGVSYVDLAGAGFEVSMLGDATHPNAKGMDFITNEAIDVLAENCPVEPGENVVYSVEHNVDCIKPSLAYYKGISAGKTFEEYFEGTVESISVTMGGKDVTESVYENGKVTIANVTGNIVVTAEVHSYESAVTPPTCTEQGFTTHTCSVCGDSYVDSYVDALGHTEVIDEAVAPTCTETGLTEGKHCSVCGTVIVEQEVVPATGHTLSDWETVTEATATEPGEEQRHCENCDYFETREIPAKGYPLGDVNLDGEVNVMDAYYARLVAAKLIVPTEQQILVGDVDGDGKITAIDANIIRKFVAKIFETFPVEW